MDVDDTKLIRTLELGPYRGDEMRDMSVSPDGKWLVSVYQSGIIRRWNTTTWKGERITNGNNDNELQVFSVRFSPDGK